MVQAVLGSLSWKVSTFGIVEGENDENRTQMSEDQKGETVGLFLARFLYLGICTSEQSTTTLLEGAKLKKSCEVVLEVQQASRIKCPRSNINVGSTHLTSSPSLEFIEC